MNEPAPPSTDARFDPPRLARALRADRLQFAALGLLCGAWGVHVPSVKQAYGLDEFGLSMVLLTIAVGSLSALLFAGRAIGRVGARRAAALASVGMGSVLASALLWPSMALMLPAMLLFGASMSLFDVAINAEGTVLESVGGRAVMGSLHGMFSLGGMAGAALAALLLQGQVPAALQLAGVGALVCLLSLLSSRGMLDAHPAAQADDVQFAWPRGPLLMIGLLIFAGMVSEGVMYDWIVLYLKQELGMPQSQAGFGFAVFSLAMALSRFGGDALRARHAEPRLLAGGALLAAVAMAVLLLARQPMVALLGCLCVGTGLALVVPILFNSASRVPGVSRAAALASVSSVGYPGSSSGRRWSASWPARCRSAPRWPWWWWPRWRWPSARASCREPSADRRCRGVDPTHSLQSAVELGENP